MPTQDDKAPAKGDATTTTKAQTVAQAAEASAALGEPEGEAYRVGRFGASPEAERTGKPDKGLSLASVTAGPAPDPRPGIERA